VVSSIGGAESTTVRPGDDPLIAKFAVVVFVLAPRQFIEGLAHTGLKG
jgi:hypothetical protein